MKTGVNHGRPYYLVQRLYPNPKPGFVNPFGYGVLGDFQLDYMGSAEFEWGALPDSLARFHEAENIDGGAIAFEHVEGVVVKIEALWIRDDGEPWERMSAWIAGECDGKEPAWDFYYRLSHGVRPEPSTETNLWWALNEDVFFAFAEDNAIEAFVNGLQKDGAVRKVRGAPQPPAVRTR